MLMLTPCAHQALAPPLQPAAPNSPHLGQQVEDGDRQDGAGQRAHNKHPEVVPAGRGAGAGWVGGAHERRRQAAASGGWARRPTRPAAQLSLPAWQRPGVQAAGPGASTPLGSQGRAGPGMGAPARRSAHHLLATRAGPKERAGLMEQPSSGISTQWACLGAGQGRRGAARWVEGAGRGALRCCSRGPRARATGQLRRRLHTLALSPSAPPGPASPGRRRSRWRWGPGRWWRAASSCRWRSGAPPGTE